MTKSSGTKTYLEAIRALRELIDREYDDGGWLPPGRQMAEKMGISHATYKKAVNFIVDEGSISNYIPKGHYVNPKRLRVQKIGLIMTGGIESPFLHDSDFFVSAIQYFYDHGLYSHMIQAASVDQLYENALIHSLKGLLWFNPPLKAVELVKQMTKEQKIPLVVIQNGGKEFSFCDGHVTYDGQKTARKRLSYFLERGHKKVGYIGTFKAMKMNGCLEIFSKYGVEFSDDYCVENIRNSSEKVTDLVMNKKVTGIISEGGAIVIDSLFAKLSELPEEQQPEVMIPKYKEYSRFKEPYPKIKLLDSAEVNVQCNLGLEAAKMMTDYLLNNQPLKQVKVGYK